MRIFNIFLLFFLILPTNSFLWTLFGNHNCNCCRCSFSPPPPSFSNPPRFIGPPTYISQNFPVFQTFQYPQPNMPSYPTLITTTTSSYRGPPAAAPINSVQLQNINNYEAVQKYSTNQIAYHTEINQVLPVKEDYDPPADKALTQLEDELAAEKYKYNLQKAKENEKKKEKQKKIRVFKIRPHKPDGQTGTVQWESSQVAKYTNEKAIPQSSSSNSVEIVEPEGGGEDLEEFIPIEIGSEPELAAEEPAGPPPNVRNKISHDPSILRFFRRLHRRFVTMSV